MDRNQAPANIQDGFLGKARMERTWVTVVLIGGRKLSGRIRAFDRYTLILENRGQEQMVFKHAVASIASARTFSNTIELKREPGEEKAQPTAPHPASQPARPQGKG